MSYKLAVFDTSILQFKVIKNIMITSISTNTSGVASITIGTGLSNIRVYIPTSVGADPVVAQTSYSSTTGDLTIGVYRVTSTTVLASVSTQTATVVSGVTATTTTAVTGITQSTGTASNVSTTTRTVVTSVSAPTGTVTSILSGSGISVVTSVGTDVGYWSIDTSGNLSHTHAVSTTTITVYSTTTQTVVTSVTPSTTTVTVISTATSVTVVTGVTPQTATVVSGVTATTTTAVTGITSTTTSSVALQPLASQQLEVIIMWD